MCSESQILTYLACQLGMFNCFGKCKVMGSMYVMTEQVIFLRRGSIPVLYPSPILCQGSINKFRGSHPLRDRARKLDQGIVIVR